MEQHKILCVDDEVDIVDSLERLFRKKYKVLKATSGAQALSVLNENPDISLIICDQRMPEMSGVEFLQKSIEKIPDSIRILLTGYTDIEAVITAINSGQIYQYITKPWDPRDLMTTVDRGIERFEVGQKLKQKNKELEIALEDLKSLDKAKDKFMILINHELKTPLTTLISFLDLLKETNLDDEQNKYVDRIAGSCHRLKEIIFDVLELVSAETGQIRVTPVTISLEKMLNDIEGSLTRFASQRKIKFKYDIGVKSINADPKITSSVLRRLCHNAIKFSEPEKEITLKVTDKGGQTSFSVSNEGKPIPESTIQQILKPFTIDEDIMNHSKGLGLGLSVSQALLKILDSELKFSNQKDSVTVSFQLPTGL